MKRIPFNVIETVYVKFTDAGRAELKRQHNDLKRDFPQIGEEVLIKEDEFGWSKWQLWSLIDSFGHLVNMGNTQLPFETLIEFSVKE